MTEEDYFRKNYPDSCYGDRPLSPHWDFFQDGVEFGERQSEKKIADLEKENREQKKLIEWLDMAINSDIPIADKLAELEKVCNKNMELADEIDKLEKEKCELLGIIQGKDEAIKNLTQNLEDTEIINKTLGERCNQLLADKGKLTDKYKELEAQFTLKITSCIKTHLCKQDEDYDEPIISPKFLSDILDQMAADGFEEIKEK